MDSEFAVIGRAILPGSVTEERAVVVRGGIITAVGAPEETELPGRVIRARDRYIAPGFVDIHCHAGGGKKAWEDPEAAAEYHYRHGTTGMLLSLTRDLTFGETLAALEKIKKAMKRCPNILGAHMEGPYLSPHLGAGSRPRAEVRREEYMACAETGIIRQWTFAPEAEGTGEFLRDIVKMGIVPAIGHSAASPEQVFAAVKGGARIVTHICDATGCAVDPPRYGGTLEASFDCAAMLCDELTCEMIVDSRGAHLRPEVAKLILKTVGIDRAAAITDCYAGEAEDGSDINIENGELCGSRLTMLAAARNLLALGLSLTDVFKMCSYNPARAVRADNVGRIAVGRRADLLLVSGDLRQAEVIK